MGFACSKSTIETPEQCVNSNKDTRTTSVTLALFWCLYYWLWTYFTHWASKCRRSSLFLFFSFCISLFLKGTWLYYESSHIVKKLKDLHKTLVMKPSKEWSKNWLIKGNYWQFSFHTFENVTCSYPLFFLIQAI